MAQSKQYKDNAQKFDRDALHSDADAVAILKSFGTKKFDETVDIVVRLGVDPRKADQMIRSTVALPSGTGKDVRIAVFAQGEAARPPATPAPTTSVATISPKRWRRA